ncbi:MAG: hypothetical protein D6688_00755, partial [Alphaproteobacteria bacterium]
MPFGRRAARLRCRPRKRGRGRPALPPQGSRGLSTLGVILAGGLGRRMGGRDKAFLRLGEETLLARVMRRLSPQVDALVVNANG